MPADGSSIDINWGKSDDMLRTLTFLSCALGIAGCGTTTAVKFDVPARVSVPFQLSDNRPTEDRASSILTTSEGSTNFYADDNLTPVPPELLRAYLAQNLPRILDGKSVLLDEFRVKVFDPAVSVDTNRLAAVSSTPTVGALAAPVILGIESMRSKKFVSVLIRGRVGETEFKGFSTGNFRGRATEEDIRSVILDALNESVHSIQAVLVR